MTTKETTYFLTTKRLGFRLWQSGDLPFATSLWGNSQVTHFIHANGPFSDAEIQQRLALELDNEAKFQLQYFPFFELKTGKFIGVCGFRPEANSTNIEFGLHLLPDFWHQGIATEAAVAILNYGFDQLHLTTIVAGHHPDNLASKKLLTKLGFQLTGTEFYAPTGLRHPTYQLTKAPKIS